MRYMYYEEYDDEMMIENQGMATQSGKVEG
jgi:hypothetical protein